MGYSSGTKIIRLVTKHLSEMCEALSNERLEWEADDPTKLAYYLHSALAASEKRVKQGGPAACEPYLSYAKLKSKYIIRKTSNSVVADPRDITPLEAVRVSMGSMVMSGLVEPLEIVGAAIKHKAPEMSFPDASIEEVGLVQIYNWSIKNDYKVIVLSHSLGGIKLSKSAADDVAWNPNTHSTTITKEVLSPSENLESTLPTSQDITTELLGILENPTT